MSLLSRWLRSEKEEPHWEPILALTAAYAGGYLVAGHLSSSFGWRTGIFGHGTSHYCCIYYNFLCMTEFERQQKRKK
jgi:hypothetical protein